MDYLPLLKELGINTTNLKSNDKLYEGGLSNTYSYKNSSAWAFTINTKSNFIEVNKNYYPETKTLKNHNKKAFKRFNKLPLRYYDLINWNLKSAINMNINQKINYNILSFKLKYVI